MGLTLLLMGTWSQTPEPLGGLVEAGYTLRPAGEVAARRAEGTTAATLLLVALTEETALPEVAAVARRGGVPWLAWAAPVAPATVAAAYRAGARAVLPGESGIAVLLEAITHTLPSEWGVAHPIPGLRRWARGATIALTEDVVLEVQTGVVALTAVHSDGTEVLLGLYGPGGLLTSHPADSCHLRLVAHTDVTATVRWWQDVLADPLILARLRTRLRQMEAWAAMQARPYLDGRILGILSLLAEQFGVPHPLGTLVDVRITHAQLASAVGATRTTVTRLLGELRTRGVLTTVGRGNTERTCLCQWEPHVHATPDSVQASAVS